MAKKYDIKSCFKKDNLDYFKKQSVVHIEKYNREYLVYREVQQSIWFIEKYNREYIVYREV